MSAQPIRTGVTLSTQVAADLRDRIESGEWDAGERLPGEHDLAKRYRVSRATIRTALQDLESRGLTVTRHGSGTIVTARSHEDRADLRRLESMTDTIRRRGRTPGVHYRSIAVRAPEEHEVTRLQLTPGAEVLATERSLTADGETVAFSHDVIPLQVLSKDFDPSEVDGSLFALLERHGVTVAVSVTDIDVTSGDHVGWGDRPDDALYLVLTQLHSDRSGIPVALARTYFVDGRFQFTLARHR